MRFSDYSMSYHRWKDMFPSYRGTPSHFRENYHAIRKSFRHLGHNGDAKFVYDATCNASVFLEGLWIKRNRPFYNIWPPIVEMIRHVDLSSVQLDHVQFPVKPLLLRFPVESFVRWVLALPDHENGFSILALTYTPEWEAFMPIKDNSHLQELLGRNDVGQLAPSGIEITKRDADAFPFTARAIVLVSLLANDPRIIQPIVLDKDRHEYMVTKDEERKKLLELRAIRKQGMGFEIGREWHETRDTSPHFRNAHLCLFWTGKERSQPTIKLRKGCMVQPRKMLEIPTGYMGPEVEEIVTS